MKGYSNSQHFIRSNHICRRFYEPLVVTSSSKTVNVLYKSVTLGVLVSFTRPVFHFPSLPLVTPLHHTLRYTEQGSVDPLTVFDM